MSSTSFMNESPDKFNIFRVYSENHSDNLSFKPLVIESKKEISFAPIVIPQYRSGLEPQKDLSVCPALLNIAIVDAADETISMITDINEFIQAQNFPAAEHLLGRKLTVEEMTRGSVFALGKKSVADQIDAELDREDLKEQMRLARTALRPRPPRIITPIVTPIVTPAVSPVHTPTPPHTPPPVIPPRSSTPPPTPAKPVAAPAKAAPALPSASAAHAIATGNYNFYYTSMAGKNLYFDSTRKTDLKDRSAADNIRKQMVKAYPDIIKDKNPLFNFNTKSSLDLQTSIFKAANQWIIRRNKDAAIAAASQSASSSTGTGLGLFQRKMKQEDWVPFGKFLLNKAKLDSKHIFSLVYRGSGQKPEFIKNASLSPALHGCIQSFLDGEPMDQQGLDPEEKEWQAYVWEKCMGVKPKKSVLRIAGSRITTKGMLDRLKICLGEIQAGNDNPAILEEIKELMVKLDARKAIAKADINKLQQFIALSI